jgi:hypothetical protein
MWLMERGLSAWTGPPLRVDKHRSSNGPLFSQLSHNKASVNLRMVPKLTGVAIKEDTDHKV